jgi:hypothetical protein
MTRTWDDFRPPPVARPPAEAREWYQNARITEPPKVSLSLVALSVLEDLFLFFLLFPKHLSFPRCDPLDVGCPNSTSFVKMRLQHYWLWIILGLFTAICRADFLGEAAKLPPCGVRFPFFICPVVAKKKKKKRKGTKKEREKRDAGKFRRICEVSHGNCRLI